jgi:osmoprotectant transport system ATP-binding protein
MPEPAIALSDVSVRYGDVLAVDRISLAVAKGELVALVGGSGCGKTTTLKTVNRLVTPSSGVVRVAGRDVRELEAHALRRRVGYCFQGVGLFPHLDVAANVGITPRLLGWDGARIRDRVAALLAMVDLPVDAYGARMPSELSGGQRQRVGVARALAAEPEVVLFDEPFGALDPITREQLQDELCALRERLAFTALFVTHDLVEAVKLADRIAVLREGRVAQIGTARELFHAPADDYVARLVESQRRQRARIDALEDAP